MKAPPPDLAERLFEVGDRVLDPGREFRIEELAELTGVARATLYYYFSGKDDVVAFLLSQQLERGTAVVTDAAHSQGSPSLRLEAVLRAMFGIMAEHPALCTRLLCLMANEGTAGQLMADVERTLMAPVRELLLEGRSTGEFVVSDLMDTTLSLMGAVSTVSMAHVANGTFEPDAIADRLVPQLLHGLQPRR